MRIFILLMLVSCLSYGDGYVSTQNSTSTILGAGEVFTGGKDDLLKWASISVTYDSDVASADSGLSMQFSTDGVNWDRQIPITPEANNLETNFGGVHVLSVIAKYFRVVYTNGSDAQTEFRLQTIYSENRNLAVVSRSDQVLNKHNDVSLVRVVEDPFLDRARGLIGYQTNVFVEGANAVVGTSFEIIGAESTTYTFPQAAETIRIKAGGDANDTAAGTGCRNILVAGLDASWAEQTDTIVTAGASASSATTNTYIRINDITCVTTGTYHSSNTDIITVENTSTNSVMSIMPADEGRQDQAIYSVPAGKTAYIREIEIEVSDSNTATVQGYLVVGADDVTAPFNSHTIFKHLLDFKGVESETLSVPIMVPEKSDIYFIGKKITGGGSAQISVEFEIILVDDAS